MKSVWSIIYLKQNPLCVLIKNMYGIISYWVRQRSLKKQLLDCVMDNDEHDGAALNAKLPATLPFQPPVI